MSLNGKKIGVMMGGSSAEREISLKSGEAVIQALRQAHMDVVPLEVTAETEEAIRQLIVQASVDCVFVAMHGGFGEGGALQHILEKIPVAYTGPREEASRLAMDKIASRRLFRKAGLSVPCCRVVKKGDSLFWRTLFLRYPVVVKPSAQGSSIGVTRVDAPRRLRRAIDHAFKYGEALLLEEFIRGREVTVSVLDGEALPVVEIVPRKPFFDFEAKYHKGLTDYHVPAALADDVAQRIQKDAVRAYRALGCRHLSRVDIILTPAGVPCILEVNTIPGMTQTSLSPKAAKAAGMDFDRLCQRLIEMACQTKT